MGKYDQYIGKKARLKYEVRTKGGSVFPKGSIVRISGRGHGHGLMMKMRDPDPKNLFGGLYLVCTNVELYYFDFDYDKTPEPEEDE